MVLDVGKFDRDLLLSNLLSKSSILLSVFVVSASSASHRRARCPELHVVYASRRLMQASQPRGHRIGSLVSRGRCAASCNSSRGGGHLPFDMGCVQQATCQRDPSTGTMEPLPRERMMSAPKDAGVRFGVSSGQRLMLQCRSQVLGMHLKEVMMVLRGCLWWLNAGEAAGLAALVREE